MIVRCNRKLKDYDYLVMFDLASHKTGVCVWDIKNNKPVKTCTLVVTKEDGIFVSNLYEQIHEFFVKTIMELRTTSSQIFISKEAMPTQLRGGSSTVQTFIALAKAHAILDLCSKNFGLDVYDYTGVYPATTHAYLRKVLGLESKAAIDKKDIKKYIEENYGITVNSLDESDAVFLAVTLINTKWNKDIDEEIKEVKKHKKILKSAKAIRDCDDLMEELEKLKN